MAQLIYPRLDDDNASPVTLVAGQQVVNVSKNSRLQGLSAQGKTLINHAGILSRWNSLNGYLVTGATMSIDTTKDSLGCLKAVQTNQFGYLESSTMIPVVAGEYFVVLVDIWNESATSINFKSYTYNSAVLSSFSVSGMLAKEWRTVAYRFAVANSGNMRPYCEMVGAVGNVSYYRNLRVYKITLEESTRLSTAGIDQISSDYFWTSGATGVDGLYVKRYGKNLLPSIPNVVHANAKVNGAYDITMISSTSDDRSTTVIDSLDNQQYTFSYEGTGKVVIQAQTKDGTLISQLKDTNSPSTHTFTTPTNTKKLLIIFFNFSTAGTFTFKNWTLVLGDASMLPKTFIPREDNLLTFGGLEFHANPLDGSSPDILRESNGQYEVVKSWKKMDLDGTLDWIYGGSLYNTFKMVRVAIPSNMPTTLTIANSFVSKFNGNVLRIGTTSSSTADLYFVASGYLYVSITNENSGWGSSYTPSPIEIKAYFDGWKMYDSSATPNGTGMYNRTDGLNKCWAQRNPDGVSYVNGTIGTTPPSYVGWIDFIPYQILFKFSAPVVQPVQQEGDLSLIEGNNFIEVGSGYVSRERVNPVKDGDYYHFNNKYTAALMPSKFKYQTERIEQIYAGMIPANGVVLKNEFNAYGKSDAHIAASDFDIRLPYSASYIKFDKSPVTSIVGTYATTEEAQLYNITQGVTKAISKVSAVELKKSDLDSVVLFKPTLINGWVNFGDIYDIAGFYKDSYGTVRLKGLIKGTTMNVPAFILPLGHRPKAQKLFTVIGDNGMARVDVRPNGEVAPIGAAGTTFLSLEGIEFNIN